MMPQIGSKFPDLSTHTTHGDLILPTDYKGKWFVLFSHPADFTPVCTTEFAAFQERYEDFRKEGAELIGLSIDQVFSHMKWTEWIKDNLDVNIEFPIIADHGNVAKKLGMIHPDKGSNTVRAVFIVDPQGVLRAMLYYPQELGRNIDEILRMVRAFRKSDEEKVAMPADWPNNGLIGDKVILPPASNVTEVNKRKEQDGYECKDWWFCYK
ncbi:MAG: peroxiredoxin [Nanobdellota archaeon]